MVLWIGGRALLASDLFFFFWLLLFINYYHYFVEGKAGIWRSSPPSSSSSSSLWYASSVSFNFPRRWYYSWHNFWWWSLSLSLSSLTTQDRWKMKKMLMWLLVLILILLLYKSSGCRWYHTSCSCQRCYYSINIIAFVVSYTNKIGLTMIANPAHNIWMQQRYMMQQ